MRETVNAPTTEFSRESSLKRILARTQERLRDLRGKVLCLQGAAVKTAPGSGRGTSRDFAPNPSSEVFSRNLLFKIYQNLVLIRQAELKIADLYPDQEIRNPVHLYIGEEAVATGVCLAVGEMAYLFGTYRSHGVYLARGGSLRAMFAELYGKEAGCSRGRGGSMHLTAPRLGLVGCSAIVGGTIPLAVGAAMASKMGRDGHVGVAFFGDGAADEGVLHESMNFAALKRLPVIFVCENNLYATHSHQLVRQPLDNLHRRAEIYGFPGIRLDGNNVLEVYDASRQAAARARRGEGPTFLECRTYRWRGHVGPETDFHLGYRSEDEFTEWKSRDPVGIFQDFLIKKKGFTPEELEVVTSDVRQSVEDAVRFAKEAPFPVLEAQEDVYSA